MSLQKLDIYGVRNIQHASLQPSPGLNFIFGRNGSGKSSILEAIFILGRAASFRSSQIKNVINHNAAELIVSGQALQANGFYAGLGVQLNNKGCEIHINQAQKQKRSALAYSLPIQLIHPTSYLLVDGGSANRREFMDWGVFNHEMHFLPLWRRFKKSLLQRNALLKSKSLQQISVWDREFVEYAEIVAKFRFDYMQILQPFFLEICNQFLDIENVQLSVCSGWDIDKDLQVILNDNIHKDYRYGFTQFGPHRGDFHLLINGKLAKDVVSRGQLKLLVLALKLAQVHLLHQKFSKIGCILIDDLAAELDFDNRFKLIHYLVSMGFQAFITATDPFFAGNLTNLQDFKAFHLEHGNVIQTDVPRGTS